MRFFELPLGEVPNFTEGSAWFTDLALWLDENYDLEPVMLALEHDKGVQFFGSGFYIVMGDSARGTVHACVGKDSRILHDPHPSRSGVKPQEIITFAAKNPQRLRKNS